MTAEELAQLIDKDTASRLPSMADTRRDWTDVIKQFELDVRESALREAVEVATKEKNRCLKRAKEYIDKGEVCYGHPQLNCEIIEAGILSLVWKAYERHQTKASIP